MSNASMLRLVLALRAEADKHERVALEAEHDPIIAIALGKSIAYRRAAQMLEQELQQSQNGPASQAHTNPNLT